MESIILIDDDTDDLEMVVSAIKTVDQSIECLPIRDCTVALKLLKDENIPQPSCIFLDLHLPKINGDECLVAIRAIPRLAKVPVVILSGSLRDGDIHALLEHGANYFFKKTHDIGTYPQMIQKIIKEVAEENSAKA